MIIARSEYCHECEMYHPKWIDGCNYFDKLIKKEMKKLTEKQSLAIRAYLAKERLKLKDLAEYIGCHSSQLTGYLNGVPMSIERYSLTKEYCKL